MRRWKGDAVSLKVADFEHYLGSNFRRIDDANPLTLDSKIVEHILLLPHIQLDGVETQHRTAAWANEMPQTESKLALPRLSGNRSHIYNRTILAAVTNNEWQNSIALYNLAPGLGRTVKYEEVYRREYADVWQAAASLARYFDFYNHERPHQSLQYKAPAEVYGQRILSKSS